MKIRIAYEVPTMNGNSREHVMFAESFEEAEEICQAIDRNEYRLIDVTRDVYSE